MDQVYGPFLTRKQALERGLRRYFDGKPCRNGHISERGVRKWNCLACDRQQKAAERLRDPERVRANEKRTRVKNQAAVRERIRRWQQGNPERLKGYRESLRERMRLDPQYANHKREVHRQWKQAQRDQRSNHAISTGLRCRVNNALRAQGAGKSESLIRLLGCSIPELRRHLETGFLPGMTWENWGREGWHIDHIIPCASFDLSDPKQQAACFHYTNLQPLWAAENIGKGARLPHAELGISDTPAA